MPQPSYAYAVARVRVLESKLIGKDKINRMTDANDAESVLKILAETDYASDVAELTSPYEYEQLLLKQLERTTKVIMEITPNIELTKLFFFKYDIHNIKVLLKQRYLKDDSSGILATNGTITLSLLKKAIEDQQYNDLPEFIKQALISIDHEMNLKVDPFIIETILDKAVYNYMLKTAKENKSSFVLGYLKIVADLTNIKSVLRIKKLSEGYDLLKKIILPGGSLSEKVYQEMLEETYEQISARYTYSEYSKVITDGIESFLRNNTFTMYERLFDNYLTNYIRRSKSNPFGIEPLIGYFLARENEIKLIRIIMVGKINNIPADMIRERLRDVYA